MSSKQFIVILLKITVVSAYYFNERIPILCPSGFDHECHELVNYNYECLYKFNKHNPNVPVGKEFECHHKQFWPLKPFEWLGTFVFAFFMLLASIGGVGGGGIAIPII